MRAAVVCEDSKVYEDIKKLLQLKTEECDQYLSYVDFKQCCTLYYDYLVLHTNALSELNTDKIKEIKKNCTKKGIRLMLFDSEINSKIIEDTVEDPTEQAADSSPDTVELRPDYCNNNISAPEKIEVIKTVYSNVPQMNICIAGLSRKAGSTFISLNLAKALAEHNFLVAVIEPPFGRPYIFDYIGFHQRFQCDMSEINDYLFIGDVFENDHHKIKKEMIQDDILWLIMNPVHDIVYELDDNTMGKIFQASKRSSVNIVDIGNHLNIPLLRNYLDYFDRILIIVDPLPPEILQNEDMLTFIQKLKSARYPVDFIINKYSREINLKELINYLGFAPLMRMPYIDSGLIYKAVYRCKTPYALRGTKVQLKKEMDLLIKKIIPAGLIKERRIKQKKLSGKANK